MTVIMNQTTEELIYFNYDGFLIDYFSVYYNQDVDFDLSLEKDGKPRFLDKKDKKYYLSNSL